MRIAHYTSLIAPSYLNEVEIRLKSEGLAPEWVNLEEDSDQSAPWPSALQSGVESGLVEAFLHPLALLGTETPDGLAKAAVLPSPYQSDFLFCSDGQQRGLHQLGPEWIVYTRSARIVQQVRALLPKLRVELRADASTDLLKLPHTALILSGTELCALSEPPPGGNPLHPREFPSDAGAAALALCCSSSDHHTLRTLRRLHDTKLGWQTNVERKLLRLLSNSEGRPGVHCERDAHAHWHAWATCSDAMGLLRRAQCSSSTHADLADQLFSNLFK
jgi:porphobilinogen deaminase